jgi:Tol biopolymer transport system component
MVEAEETYRSLVAKGGHRLTTDGFSARWSPDGTKLAFSLGVQGFSGVALFDPQTKETELLIVPGKDPRWSPDGKYIAFIRDRQNLRLEELARAEREKGQPPLSDEEIWLMKSDGTEPRRLARGGWPSWGSDSQHIYYLSRGDRTLCLISLAGKHDEPKQIMKCPNFLSMPSVSPDSQRVAYLENARLKVRDLTSQSLVAESPAPFAAWVGPAWSPTGRELCLSGRNISDDRTGLWIYSLDRAEPVRVLGGQVTGGAWSPDGAKLVFSLGPPCFEIWTASLDASGTTAQALAPFQTLDEHFWEMVAFYTRRIEGDPQDAYAHSSRAQYHGRLGNQGRANADMRQSSTILSGELPLNSGLDNRPNPLRVVNLPFDCELVFSAERPVNTTPIVSVAFGQKGRCEMKLFEIPMVVASLFGFGLLVTLDTASACADFVFGEPEKTAWPSVQSIGCVSYDGLEMYVEAFRAQGGVDLCVRKRTSKEEAWGPLENLGPLVNTAYDERAPSLSGDGLTLYFWSQDRPDGYGSSDVYMTTRATRDASWEPAVNMGPGINSYAGDFGPSVTEDGRELYFTSSRSGGYGRGDIYVASRLTASDAWGAPVNIGPVVNSAYNEHFPYVSPDGLLLLFSDYIEATVPRPGGYGGCDIWMTRRTGRDAPWQEPVNLGPPISGAAHDGAPRMSPEGQTLYFWSNRGGSSDDWQVSILPIIDFNGDGTVDVKDMAILSDNWGRSESLCDIAPFAWGDGIVDEKDLMVLMERLVTPAPNTTEVSCDVVLSWVSPEFVDSHDVYFGTSFDDVNNATRDDSCGALVSLGQTETTFDSEGLLDFGRTYYWRVDLVDVVIGSLEPMIYRGPVLKFTTEAFTHPITTNIVATASSSQPGTGPGNTVNGSGLDKNDGHSTDGNAMWLSTNAKPYWIQFEFEKIYALHELWVWNSNQVIEPILGFGAKTVKTEYSTDGAVWAALEGVPEFARAPGQAGYVHNTVVSLGAVSAKYVKLTIEANWGGVSPSTGLSEVRFFYIPDRPAGNP